MPALESGIAALFPEKSLVSSIQRIDGIGQGKFIHLLKPWLLLLKDSIAVVITGSFIHISLTLLMVFRLQGEIMIINKPAASERICQKLFLLCGRIDTILISPVHPISPITVLFVNQYSTLPVHGFGH